MYDLDFEFYFCISAVLQVDLSSHHTKTESVSTHPDDEGDRSRMNVNTAAFSFSFQLTSIPGSFCKTQEAVFPDS